ncbi:type IV secretion system protein [Acrocarpospora sp. B8E8]|uniref:type IV secretion system protein n=1 Tax=Acrocarpospora sp. B8E8 TaxID=3153572 RepID=UPI00325D502D
MRFVRRLALVLVAVVTVLSLPLVFASSTASADGICDLSSSLAPEMVGGGVDGLVKPPPPDTGDTGAAAGAGVGAGTPVEVAPDQQLTNYARYGMAGQFWHTYGLGCSDVAAVLGNAWANTIFSWAKAVDRLTITTYEAAATEGPLLPIKNVVDDMVVNLADAMYWPFLRPIVIIAAIWLAWYGLLRKRATTTYEGVIWMVLAVTVATWFFSRPQDLTGVGKTITDKTSEIVNSAFSGLPGAGGASCLPAQGAEGTRAANGGYGQPGTPGVAQNADALWSTLVCKPWLMGEFGTADPNAPIVATFGPKVLEIQAIDQAEQQARQAPAGDAHQQRFEEEVAKPLEATPQFFLFQGKDWTSRLSVAIGAFIAAMVAGVLIFLVSVSLLVLKIGFLLLLILGPVFLLIGVHPGAGRIIAMRWVEMLVGTLLRQAVLALVLGVLVYGYALIISTPLPWGMQIMFMALLTLAVFFYRRPFQHLFSTMGGHNLTTRMLGEAASSPILQRSSVVLPPVASARIGRWGLRKAEPVIGAASMAAGAGAGAAAATTVAQGKVRGEEQAAGATGVRATGQPAPLETDARKKAGGVPAPRPGSAPPLNLRPPAGARPGATGPRRPGGPVPSSSGSVPSSGGSSSSSGGWFGGRSGGWASRPSSASRGGSSRGSSGLFGGGSSGGRSSSGGGFFGGGGSLFGGGRRSGRSESPRAERRSEPPRPPRAETPRSSQPPRAESPRQPRSEAPPLWLPSSRAKSARGGDNAPFWLRPPDRDKD